jgi:hypothetical protein
MHGQLGRRKVADFRWLVGKSAGSNGEVVMWATWVWSIPPGAALMPGGGWC